MYDFFYFDRAAQTLVAAVGIGLLSAVPARAASFTVENITGTWDNVQGTSLSSGTGTNQIRWGSSATGATGISGFDFNSAPLSAPIASGTNFILGQLTHLNFPIFSPASGVDLAVSMDIDGVSIAFDYGFTIEETTNSGICPSFQITDTPCDDRITFSTDAEPTLFSKGGIDYTLELLGFSTTIDGLSPVSSFITEEVQASSAYLVARFVENESTEEPIAEEPASTPEPASVLALLSLGLATAQLRRPSSKR